ncbi:hypothetical protein BC937DRAFT_88695 [Endogone sp. FLAS-F59071]|nr:hypothetical protein BC937DRAFT_88695 [Endogone sp. FLAS-F59071]|eukprot:RUS18505.1 hypothetical protein BC937DRAFT_88695 [Endogone sp. FLAS-F59071]
MVAYTYNRAPMSHTGLAGWLQKETNGGFGRKTFHKRWFVLKGNELKYFKTEVTIANDNCFPKRARCTAEHSSFFNQFQEDPVPHGVIDLNDYKTVLPDATCKKSAFAFTLKPRDVKEHKSYLFFADSQEEMRAWMKAIQPHVGDHEPESDRSVLDKWLDRLDLTSPSFESSRSKTSTFSPTSPTFSKTSSEFDSKHLRSRKSNSSLSSDDSVSSADSSVFSDAEPGYKEKAKQQLRDKLLRTTSMPPILREPTDQMGIPVITSAPNSPTFDNLASRRNVQLPPLPLKGIILVMESSQASPFLQTPPKVEKWETERARKRRSNSVPRFDCFKTGGCITPTFGTTAF